MFIGLDTPGDVDYLTSTQLTFLDSRLTYAENAGLVHAFIYFHGPMYYVESVHCDCPTRTDSSCTPTTLISVINKHPIVSAFFHGHEHILGWTHIDNTRLAAVTGSFEEFLTSSSGSTNYNSYLYPARMDYTYMAPTDTQVFATITVNGNSFTVNFYKTGTDIPVWTKTFTKGIPIATNTPSPTLISIPTETSTPIATLTDTPVPGPSLTPTFTFTPSNTPLPPTATATFTVTPTTGPGGSTLTFIANADSYVRDAGPTSNYGTNVQLWVDSGTNENYEGYLKFTVSGVIGSVQSATLRVYSTSSTVDGPAVYATTSTWTETGITWNTRPARTSAGMDDKGAIATGVWVEYNVTPLVMSDGTYSFALVTTSTDSVSFSSREGSQPPQLVLNIGP